MKKINQQKERILAYTSSTNFTEDDLKNISGGRAKNSTSKPTGRASFDRNSGLKDAYADFTHDF